MLKIFIGPCCSFLGVVLCLIEVDMASHHVIYDGIQPMEVAMIVEGLTTNIGSAPGGSCFFYTLPTSRPP